MHIWYPIWKSQLRKKYRAGQCWLEHVRNSKKMLKQAKHIFDTFEYFWVDHKSKFFCNCLATRWRCDQFFQKSPKSKSDNTFTLKKPFVTPNFCKRNLSRMHCFEIMNSFTFKITPVWDNLELDSGREPEQFWNLKNSQF